MSMTDEKPAGAVTFDCASSSGEAAAPSRPRRTASAFQMFSSGRLLDRHPLKRSMKLKRSVSGNILQRMDTTLGVAQAASRRLRRRIRCFCFSTGLLLLVVSLVAMILELGPPGAAGIFGGVTAVSPLIAGIALRALQHRLVLALSVVVSLLLILVTALFALEIVGWFDGSACTGVLNATGLVRRVVTQNLSSNEASDGDGVGGRPRRPAVISWPSVCWVLGAHRIASVALTTLCLVLIVPALPKLALPKRYSRDSTRVDYSRGASPTVSAAMPTRLRLLQLFLVGRCFVGVDGLLQLIAYGYAAGWTWWVSAGGGYGGGGGGDGGVVGGGGGEGGYGQQALFQCLGGAIQLIISLMLPPSVRQKVHAYLSRVGSHSEARAASTIAALIGYKSPQAVLRLARSSFRTISWEQLYICGESAGRRGVFADADLAGASDLHERTIKTELGDADVFLSHSWRGDPLPFSLPLSVPSLHLPRLNLPCPALP